jgi:hypothetical protein
MRFILFLLWLTTIKQLYDRMASFLIRPNVGELDSTAILHHETNQISDQFKISAVDDRPPLTAGQDKPGIAHVRQVK